MVLSAALTIYVFLTFVLDPTERQRRRIAGLVIVGIGLLAAAVASATQIEKVSNLLTQRATLDQS